MISSTSDQQVPLFDISFSEEELRGSLTTLLRFVDISVYGADKISKYLDTPGYENTGTFVVLNEQEIDHPVFMHYFLKSPRFSPIEHRQRPHTFAGFQKADFRTDLWETVCAVRLMSFARECWDADAYNTRKKLPIMRPLFSLFRVICDSGLVYGLPNIIVVYLPEKTISPPAPKKFSNILLGYTKAQTAIASVNTFLERL